MIDRKGLFVLVIFAAVVSGCVTPSKVRTAEHLQKYVVDNGYEPFALPRDNWGSGTVVRFSGGRENIVFFNDQCLALSGPGDMSDIRMANVSLPESSYKISRSAKLEASLAKDFAANIDIGGAYNDTRVAAVNVALKSPKELVASQGSIVARIRSLIAAGNPCVDMLFADGVFVIDRVVAVDGFSYSLDSSENQGLRFDAAILKAINASPTLSATLEGKATMSSDTPRIVGYRLFRYTAEAGLAEPKITESRVSSREISVLRGSPR